VTPGAIHDRSAAWDTVTAVVHRKAPEDDAPLAEHLEYLRNSLGDLRSEIGGVRQAVGDAEQRLSGWISELHEDAQRRDQELSQLIRDVATGGVPRELRGLLLVGFGSVLSAVPGLMALERPPVGQRIRGDRGRVSQR
jgi:hypothetical protein